MTKGKLTCHVGGVLLTKLLKARMRKSRKTVNKMNLAGLTPGHYMNYLMLLSDLRDLVLYIGISSLPQLVLGVYITFYSFVRCDNSTVSVRQRVTRRSVDVPLYLWSISLTASCIILQVLIVPDGLTW